MSNRPKSSQSVALFPFLAVLVCTMGSLIFLLLVTTRMIRDIAVAQANTSQNPPAKAEVAEQVAAPITIPAVEPEPEAEPEIAIAPQFPQSAEPAESKQDLYARTLAQRQREQDDLTEKWNGKVRQLKSQHDDLVRLLNQRKLLSNSSKQRIAESQTELREMEVTLGNMTGELSANAMGTGFSKEHAELEKLIAELKRQLRAAQQHQHDDENKFEVVPFDVNTGTSRRPILIECTETGIRFIPEDVTVRPGDLAGFTPQVNPVIAGAGALINYWTAWNIRQPNPGKEPEPYVLLLVRPSGTIAYYKAMELLGELRRPFGYELIEEDTVLQMPPVDQGSKAACEAAVNRLLTERNQAMKAAGLGGFGTGRGGAGRGTGGTTAADGRGGGGGGPGTGASGGGSATAGGRGGREGAGAGASADRFELPDILPKDADGNWDRVENFEGRHPRARGTQTADNGKSGTGRGSAGLRGNVQDPGTGSGSLGGGVPKGGVPKGRAGGGLNGDGSPGGTGADGDSMANGTDQGTGESTKGTAAGKGRPNGKVVTTASEASEDATDSVPPDLAGKPDIAGKPGKPGARRAGNAKAGPSVGAGGSTNPNGIESLEDSDEGADTDGPVGNSDRPDIGLGSTGTPAIPVLDQRHKRGKSSDKPTKFQPEQLNSHHWGLSDPGAVIGLERELRVDVEGKRIVIAGKHAVSVGEADSREDIFARMVTVMDLQARDWGHPPQGFFWKPSLRYVIGEGGETNYEQVHPLLEQAGLSSTREYANARKNEAVATPAVPTTGPTTPEVAIPAAPAPANPKSSRRFFKGILR